MRQLETETHSDDFIVHRRHRQKLGNSVSVVHFFIQLSFTDGSALCMCPHSELRLSAADMQLQSGRGAQSEQLSDDEGIPAEKSAHLPGLVSGFLSASGQGMAGRVRGASVCWRRPWRRPVSSAPLCL